MKLLNCIALGLLLIASAQAFQDTREVTADGLIYDLQHPDADRRREAARHLGLNKIRQAVPALIDAAGDPDDGVRLEVVGALVKINDTRALGAYVGLTADPRNDIQEKAIEGLVEMYVVEEDGFVQSMGRAIDFINPLNDDFNAQVVEAYVPVSASAVDALRLQLFDDSSSVRRRSAQALGILRASAALPDLALALESERNRDVKVELIRSIYKIGDASYGSRLIPLLNDDSKKVRDEAIFVLGRLRVAEAVPPLTDRLGVQERRKVFKVLPVSGKDDLRKRALRALADIGDPRSKEVFINALADPREDYRRFGAEGLAHLGDKSMLLDLAKQQLTEKSHTVRLALGLALYRLGRPEHLVQIVDSLQGGDQGYSYLLEFTPAETVQLHSYLESPQPPKVRRRLLDVLGLRGDQTSLPLVQRHMQDPDPEIVSAATMALRRLNARSPQGQ